MGFRKGVQVLKVDTEAGQLDLTEVRISGDERASYKSEPVVSKFC